MWIRKQKRRTSGISLKTSGRKCNAMTIKIILHCFLKAYHRYRLSKCKGFPKHVFLCSSGMGIIPFDSLFGLQLSNCFLFLFRFCFLVFSLCSDELEIQNPFRIVQFQVISIPPSPGKFIVVSFFGLLICFFVFVFVLFFLNRPYPFENCNLVLYIYFSMLLEFSDPFCWKCGGFFLELQHF